jgi:type VI protein secretion system component VasF
LSDAEGPTLLVRISRAQQEVEARRAHEVEAMRREWRRTWLQVFLQCVVLAVAGYLLYGVSWALRSGIQSELIAAISFVIAYALPFFRLVFFFVKHADQF